MPTFYGTSGNDAISGTSGNDIIYGYDGDDHLSGDDTLPINSGGDDQLYGGHGDDWYYYLSGKDIFSEFSGSGYDVIKLSAGYNSFNDIDFYRDIYNNLIIKFDNNNYITTQSFFGNTNNAIEELKLSDGTTMNLIGQQYKTKGTSNDDYLSGIVQNGSIHDILYGYEGNDQLYGGEGDDYLDGGIGNDQLYGGTGDDIYHYLSGKDSFSESGGNGYDIITFDAQYQSFDNLDIYRDVNNNLIIQIDSNNQITVQSFFGSTNMAIEELRLSDNSIMNLIGQQYETKGTSNDDYLSGIVQNGSIHDMLYGHEGNDQLYGGEGDDYLDGGAGNDQLFGDAGNDILSGGLGADVLKGGTGSDTFVFEADSAFDAIDTIQDFKVLENDKIDISELLDGYDPIMSDINDYVSLSVTGSNTTLLVDRDGTGTAYGSEAIAILSNTSGLNVDDLFNNGHLII